MFKVLFLHGWWSSNSVKCLAIKCMGYDVFAPALSNWSFNRATKQAQEACNKFNPNVVVGSSRGGAAAMCLETNKPLILLAPAWKLFGCKNIVNSFGSVVIHSKEDSVVAYEDSLVLCNNNPGLRLITAGKTHQLNDQEALNILQGVLSHLTIIQS